MTVDNDDDQGQTDNDNDDDQGQAGESGRRGRAETLAGNEQATSGPTAQDKNLDYLCPICFELITEVGSVFDIFRVNTSLQAHMTRCGHTFCYACLLQTIEQTSRCPKCNFTLDSTEQIFPNFLLNELVSKYRASAEHQLRSSTTLSHPDLSALRTALTGTAGEAMSLPDVELMLRLLEARRQQLAAQSVLSQKQLLREFLQHMKKQKDEQLFGLQKEAAVIEADLEHVEVVLRGLERGQEREVASQKSEDIHCKSQSHLCQVVSDTSVVPVMEDCPEARDLGGFNLLADKAALGGEEASLAARRSRFFFTP